MPISEAPGGQEVIREINVYPGCSRFLNGSVLEKRISSGERWSIYLPQSPNPFRTFIYSGIKPLFLVVVQIVVCDLRLPYKYLDGKNTCLFLKTHITQQYSRFCSQRIRTLGFCTSYATPTGESRGFGCWSVPTVTACTSTCDGWCRATKIRMMCCKIRL